MLPAGERRSSNDSLAGLEHVLLLCLVYFDAKPDPRNEFYVYLILF